MTGPLDIGLTLVKNVGPLTRNLFSIMRDAALAKDRVLVEQQRRSLAERFNVAPTVIDALMERELETRESTSHGMRLEVKEPSTGFWTGERIGGDVYVSVRNEWVHPATLTKMAATIEVPGWDAHVDVTSEDKDRLIPGMTAHSIKLRWSWLTTPDQLRQFRLLDDRLSDITLTVTPTASILWEGSRFAVEQAFSMLVLVSPRCNQMPL